MVFFPLLLLLITVNALAEFQGGDRPAMFGGIDLLVPLPSIDPTAECFSYVE